MHNIRAANEDTLRKLAEREREAGVKEHDVSAAKIVKTNGADYLQMNLQSAREQKRFNTAQSAWKSDTKLKEAEYKSEITKLQAEHRAILQENKEEFTSWRAKALAADIALERLRDKEADHAVQSEVRSRCSILTFTSHRSYTMSGAYSST